MLPPWPELGDILVCEDVALEIGEVDGFGPAFAHPTAGGDVVGYKGRPDGGSAGGLGLVLEFRGYKGWEARRVQIEKGWNMKVAKRERVGVEAIGDENR